MTIKRKQTVQYVITGCLSELRKAYTLADKQHLRILQSGPQRRGLKIYANTFRIIAEKE